jgi:hypothetical protein
MFLCGFYFICLKVSRLVRKSQDELLLEKRTVSPFHMSTSNYMK